MEILKEMKEKEVVMKDVHLTALFHTLSTLVTKGGAPVIRQLQDTIFTLGLAKPTSNLCSPLIGAYLERYKKHRFIQPYTHRQTHSGHILTDLMIKHFWYFFVPMAGSPLASQQAHFCCQICVFICQIQLPGVCMYVCLNESLIPPYDHS